MANLYCKGVLGGLMGRHLWDVSIAQMLDSWLPPVSHFQPSEEDSS